MPTKWTLKKKAELKSRFIEELRSGDHVVLACKALGIAKQTVYDWREIDSAFAAQWAEAIDESTERLEKEAYRRAFAGTSKPVYQGGELVGHIQEYSDTLTIFLLKSRNPDKYRERHSLDVNHDIVGNLMELAVQVHRDLNKSSPAGATSSPASPQGAGPDTGGQPAPTPQEVK